MNKPKLQKENNMDDKTRMIQTKFKIAYRECDYLEDKIFKKDGVVFKTHRYTIDELMNSPHHDKINAVTEKIGSDISYWEMSGKLSRTEKEAYYIERDKIDDVLHQLNRNIQNRQPTLWERISQVAEEFISKVMNNLPMLKELLTYAGKMLGEIPYIGKAFPILIHLGRKSSHLLSNMSKK